MDITCFDDLLEAARQQPEPQRLLFVFADSAVPEDASEAQKAAHARGEGGELTPVLCVDKTPGQIVDFHALAAESMAAGQGWQIVFVGAMADGPSAEEQTAKVDQTLQRMVQMIKYGTVGSLLAFDRQGDPIVIGA